MDYIYLIDTGHPGAMVPGFATDYDGVCKLACNHYRDLIGRPLETVLGTGVVTVLGHDSYSVTYNIHKVRRVNS